ncbi:Os02g0828533, partial [Oryza sativa Japonica Group]
DLRPNISGTRSRPLHPHTRQYLHDQSKSKVKTELTRYLEDIPQENDFPDDDFDILQWWRVNSCKYPILSRMALDLLAVPASSVASESAFSTGSRIISDYRSRLASGTVEALVCLQDWMRADGMKPTLVVHCYLYYGP